MGRAIILVVLLLLPSILHARVVKWEGKPIPISTSTERLTRIEFPEILRSVFLSRSDVAIEKEDRSLYVRWENCGVSILVNLHVSGSGIFSTIK